jgi:O-antigen/teichoic acid export membrane protein
MSNPASFKKESVLRTSFPLFSASFFAQGINFLLLFLLPRFFAITDIAHFFVFFAVTQIFIPLVSLQSHNSVVLSRNYKAAASNYFFSFLIGGVFSLLLFCVIIIFYFFRVIIPEIWFEWLIYVPLFVFFGSLLLTTEQFLIFLKRYNLIGASRIIKAVIIFFVTIGAGLIKPGVDSIIIGFIIGQVGVLVFLFFSIPVSFSKVTVSKNSLTMFVLRYRDILTFNTLINGLLMLINHLPAIVLSFFFGEKVVAFYGVVHRVFSTLPGIWGHSISSIFFRKCVDYYNSLSPFFFYVMDTLKRLLFWGVLYGIVAVAPWGFYTFMGEAWYEAGILAKVLMPLIVVQSIALPFTTLFTVLKIQKRIIWFYVGGFIVRIVIGLILPFWLMGLDYKSGLIIYAVTGVIYYFFYLRELFSQVKKFDKKVMKQNLRSDGTVEK